MYTKSFRSNKSNHLPVMLSVFSIYHSDNQCEIVILNEFKLDRMMIWGKEEKSLKSDNSISTVFTQTE